MLNLYLLKWDIKQKLGLRLWCLKPLSTIFHIYRSPFILLWGNLIQNLPYVLSTKFRFIWLKQFQWRKFLEIDQSEKNNCLCVWQPCLLTNWEDMSILYRGPSKDASYQVSIHLFMRFHRRRFFRNQPIRNKNGLWRPCLLTDRDEMSNLYRGPSIDDSYQVSIHLVKRFQRRIFFLNHQSKTRIACGGHVCSRIRTK